MAFDLQEQEQIDSLKLFWERWGKLVSAIILLSLTSYLGYQGWQYYQRGQMEKAAVLYVQLEQKVQAGDLAKVKSAVSLLQDAHGKSAYAANAALIGAKMAFDNGDLPYARAQLKWVIAGFTDESLLATARLRLATVLLDEKQYDQALAELAQARPASFDTLFLDLKGDVLVARGDKGGARESYKAALAKASPDASLRDFIQTKLDSLGN